MNIRWSRRALTEGFAQLAQRSSFMAGSGPGTEKRTTPQSMVAQAMFLINQGRVREGIAQLENDILAVHREGILKPDKDSTYDIAIVKLIRLYSEKKTIESELQFGVSAERLESLTVLVLLAGDVVTRWGGEKLKAARGAADERKSKEPVYVDVELAPIQRMLIAPTKFPDFHREVDRLTTLVGNVKPKGSVATRPDPGSGSVSAAEGQMPGRAAPALTGSVPAGSAPAESGQARRVGELPVFRILDGPGAPVAELSRTTSGTPAPRPEPAPAPILDEAALLRAFEESPTSLEHVINIVSFYVSNGRLEQALPYLEHGLSLSSTNVTLLSKATIVYGKLRRSAEFLAAAVALWRISLRNLFAISQIGFYYFNHVVDEVRAHVLFQYVLSIKPDHPAALAGKRLMERQPFSPPAVLPQALTVLEEAAESAGTLRGKPMRSTDPEAERRDTTAQDRAETLRGLIRQARRAYEKGEWNESVEAVLDAEILDANHRDVKSELARLFGNFRAKVRQAVTAGKSDEAITLCRCALLIRSTDPESVELWRRLQPGVDIPKRTRKEEIIVPPVQTDRGLGESGVASVAEPSQGRAASADPSPASAPTPPPTDLEKAAGYITSGNGRLEGGRFKEAAGLFRAALEVDPQNSSALAGLRSCVSGLLRLAQAELARGGTRGAETFLRQAEEVGVVDGTVSADIARVRGEIARAGRPGTPSPRVAAALAASGTSTLPREPQAPTLRSSTSLAPIPARRAASAEEAGLLAEFERNPNDLVTLNKLMGYYVSQRAVAAALPYLDRALALRPDGREVLLNAIRIFRNLNRLEEAGVAIGIYLNGHAENLFVVAQLGFNFLDFGELDKAEAIFSYVLTKNTGHGAATAGMSAVTRQKRGAAQTGTLPSATQLLEDFKATGRASRQLLARTLADVPQGSDPKEKLRKHLAEVTRLLDVGDPDKAITEWTAAKHEDPNDEGVKREASRLFGAFRAIACTARDESRHKDALRAAQQALRARSGDEEMRTIVRDAEKALEAARAPAKPAPAAPPLPPKREPEPQPIVVVAAPLPGPAPRVETEAERRLRKDRIVDIARGCIARADFGQAVRLLEGAAKIDSEDMDVAGLLETARGRQVERQIASHLAKGHPARTGDSTGGAATPTLRPSPGETAEQAREERRHKALLFLATRLAKSEPTTLESMRASGDEDLVRLADTLARDATGGLFQRMLREAQMDPEIQAEVSGAVRRQERITRLLANGRAALEHKDYLGALNHFHTLLSHDPENAEAKAAIPKCIQGLQKRSRVCVMKRDWAGVVTYLEPTLPFIEDVERRGVVADTVANAYSKLGQPDKAEQVVRNANPRAGLVPPPLPDGITPPRQPEPAEPAAPLPTPVAAAPVEAPVAPPKAEMIPPVNPPRPRQPRSPRELAATEPRRRPGRPPKADRPPLPAAEAEHRRDVAIAWFREVPSRLEMAAGEIHNHFGRIYDMIRDPRVFPGGIVEAREAAKKPG